MANANAAANAAADYLASSKKALNYAKSRQTAAEAIEKTTGSAKSSADDEMTAARMALQAAQSRFDSAKIRQSQAQSAYTLPL